ncbi:transcription initiation factor TFIID subunit 4 isoform X2 [Sitodiplosis mosellana]|uniref:transcription initiation factor TFIID subunit 4 isoform X2 n=1 Tax=Sitodiplosis mosellana TaxID=263140 RepID=UPI00244427A0|nr:transcription initiation factor TFIID subunit 4 isoform X2 [Sitodiplosis mosellana]
MASTKFLEEDLRTDVDEFTVSAIVGGSTDTNIVTAPSDDAKPPQKPPQQEQLSDFQQHLLNDNNNLLNSSSSSSSNQDNNSSAILVSNGHQSSAISDPNNALNENEKKSNDNINIIYNASDSEPSSVLANFAPTNAIATTVPPEKVVTNINNNSDDKCANQSLQQSEKQQHQHQHQQQQQTTTNYFAHQPSSESTAEVGVSHQNQHITQNQSHQPLLQQPLRQAQQIVTQQQQQQSVQVQPAMSKNNEPVKLVYPSKIPNGTINLATIPSQQQQPNIMHTSTSMAANSGTNTVTGQQPQTIVIKNQANQNIVANSMIPGVQLVNMRPNAPVAQTKTVATVSPRVVISNPHMVATRPTNPGITLSALQPGQPGSALLLKTENGQYRLLHYGPSTQTTQQTLPNSGANPTIRIQTVPSVSRFTGPPLALRKTIVTQQPVKTKASTATPIVVNSVHTTPAINTVTTRSRESINTSQLPPIASVAPVSHSIQQSALPPQPQIQTQQMNATNAIPTSNVTTSATPSHANLHNTKEKCRKFLSNLLELSSREPKPVEQNVQELIQELIDANVEPDQFCDRLERLLNASPQPCLIGFLKKSLPLLRQSLVMKELSIEGIKPPPHSVAFGTYATSNIATQVRPVVNLPAVRMVPQQTRPATITRHTAPVRLRLNAVQTEPNGAIQAPINVPRMVNSTQIRASSGAAIIHQQHPANVQIQSHPPALHPVSQNTFAPGGAQIRAASVPVARPAPAVQIRQTVTENGAHIIQQNAKMLKTAANTIQQQQSTTPTMKVGSTQIKPIINAANATAPQPIVIPQPPIIKSEPVDTNKSIAKETSATTLISTSNANATTTPAPPKMVPIKSQAAASAKSSAANKEKERKASASFFQQSSMSSSMYGDDDINDVAAMGGVNLAEESQRILGSTELIGRQIRSCKDEVFLHLPALQSRIRNIMAKHGLEEPGNEVAVLVSHACQERLKNIVEKLAVIAEHRIDIIKIDPRYEITKDVRGQIKFLEELDKAEQKRHEEQEREMLMRAAKSRSKTEDPEQAKLKAKAKEMQRAEMEELRQRDANLTALQAIGPRKKPKLESDTATATAAGGSTLGIGGATVPLRPRIKRVNLRDMIFYLEQERDTCRSTMLYKSYLK